jgi:uncharacterized protein YukE
VANLQVSPDELHDVGTAIVAAPQRSSVAPAAEVDAPAADPVSVLTTHGFSMRIAAIGSHSVTAGALTSAAGGLVQAGAATYAHSETVNADTLGAGPASAGTSGPALRPVEVPVAPLPQIPAPTVPSAPTSGKEIAQLIHGGPGPASLYAAGDRLAGHAADLADTGTQLRSAASGMQAVWESDAGDEANSWIIQLADLHTVHGQRVAVTAQTIRAQAQSFQTARDEIPHPQVFDDLERRLRAADLANRQTNGRYTGVVAALQANLATTNAEAVRGYVRYASQSTGSGAQPSPDDVIVDDGSGKHGTVQAVDFRKQDGGPQPPGAPGQPPGGTGPQPPGQRPNDFISQWEQAITAGPGGQPTEGPPMPHTPAPPVPPPAPPVPPPAPPGGGASPTDLLLPPPRAPGVPPPDSLPKPLQDYTNFLEGQPVPPPPPPVVSVEELRAQIAQQQREYETFQQIWQLQHPGCSVGDWVGISTALLGGGTAMVASAPALVPPFSPLGAAGFAGGFLTMTGAMAMSSKCFD